MTAKAKVGLSASTDYFNNIRQYKIIAELERDFFKLLLEKKNELSTVPSIQQALNNAVRFIQDPMGVPLNVLVEFEVYDTHRCKRQTMYLGTKLVPKAPSSDAQVTHGICMVEEGEYLAKIHIDRDFSSKDPTSNPSPHVQTGGRPFPGVEKKITGKPFWKDDVDKPRIPSIPFSTALLWHWAFMEYPCDRRTAPFLHTGWWPTLIRKTEEAVLKPFFDDGSKLMQYKSASGLLQAFYIPLAK
jgi:hypothetical protein